MPTFHPISSDHMKVIREHIMALIEILKRPTPRQVRQRLQLAKSFSDCITQLNRLLHDEVESNGTCTFKVPDDFFTALIRHDKSKAEILTLFYHLACIDPLMQIPMLRHGVLGLIETFIRHHTASEMKALSVNFLMLFSRTDSLEQSKTFIQAGGLNLLSELLKDGSYLGLVMDAFTNLIQVAERCEEVHPQLHGLLQSEIIPLLHRFLRRYDNIPLVEDSLRLLVILLGVSNIEDAHFTRFEIQLFYSLQERLSKDGQFRIYYLFKRQMAFKEVCQLIIQHDSFVESLLRNLIREERASEEHDGNFAIEKLLILTLLKKLAIHYPKLLIRCGGTEGCIPFLLHFWSTPIDFIDPLIATGQFLLMLSEIPEVAVQIVSIIGENESFFKFLIYNNPQDDNQKELMQLGLDLTLKLIQHGMRFNLHNPGLSELAHYIKLSESDSLKTTGLQILLSHQNMASFQEFFLSEDRLLLCLSLFNSQEKLSLLLYPILEVLLFGTRHNHEHAQKNAEAIVNQKCIKSIGELLRTENKSIQERAGLLLAQVLELLPTTPIPAPIQMVSALLKLLEHPNKMIQQRTEQTLMCLAAQATYARIFVQSGGLPFILSCLEKDATQQRAAVALINVASIRIDGLIIHSKATMQLLLDQWDSLHPKMKKRMLQAIFNLLKTHHVHQEILLELHLMEWLHRIDDPLLRPFVQKILCHLTHDAPPVSVRAAPTHPQPIRRSKKEEKIERKLAHITQHIDGLLQELYKTREMFSEFSHPRPASSRIFLKNLAALSLRLEDEIKEQARLESLSAIDAINFSTLRFEPMVEYLFNGTRAQQQSILNQLISFSTLPVFSERKEELAGLLDEARLHQLCEVSSTEMKVLLDKVDAIFFLDSRRVGGASEDRPVFRNLALPSLPPALAFVSEIQQAIKTHCELMDVTPILVGSQAHRLSLGQALDPVSDIDVEFICHVDKDINPYLLKEQLLRQVFKANTKILYLNIGLDRIELSFALKQGTNPVDVKFTLFTRVNFTHDERILKSLEMRRIMNRSCIIDLMHFRVCAYHPGWRGLNNKSVIHWEDLGYALYDLAIEHYEHEKFPDRPWLLNEPHLRSTLTNFFHTSSEENIQQVLYYAKKRVMNKIKEEPREKRANQFLRQALKNFDIELSEKFYHLTHTAARYRFLSAFPVHEKREQPYAVIERSLT